MSRQIRSHRLPLEEDSIISELIRLESATLDSAVHSPTVELDEDFCQELGIILNKQRQNQCSHDARPIHNFARYLRAARLNSALSPSALARMAGTSEAIIYALEHAMIPTDEIDTSILRSIATALDEDIHLFLLLLECATPSEQRQRRPVALQNWVTRVVSGKDVNPFLLSMGGFWQRLTQLWSGIPKNNGYYLRACSGAVGILCMLLVFYIGQPSIELSLFNSPTATIASQPALEENSQTSYAQEASDQQILSQNSRQKSVVKSLMKDSPSIDPGSPFYIRSHDNDEQSNNAVNIPISSELVAHFPISGQEFVYYPECPQATRGVRQQQVHSKRCLVMLYQHWTYYPFKRYSLQ